MYHREPPLLSDTIKDYQWYFDVTNPIVISIKSILTFMMIHIGSSGSKSNPHYECDEQCCLILAITVILSIQSMSCFFTSSLIGMPYGLLVSEK